MKSIAIGAVMGLGVLCAATEAGAEEKAARKPIVVDPGIIVGKKARPVAAVDVARATVRSPATELRASFVGKIEDVIAKEPF